MADINDNQKGAGYPEEKLELLDGNEVFSLHGRELGIKVIDYWRFQYSNLIDNLGYLAEFLVAKALYKDEPDNCVGWTLYDLNYREKRIEVKSTSYYQTWKKDHKITEQRNFSIKKTYVDLGNSNVKERQNDIYVFCVDEGWDKRSSNPLYLENWTFYVVPTKVINELCKEQDSITLSRLENIEIYGRGLKYDKIKETVDNIIDKSNL